MTSTIASTLYGIAFLAFLGFTIWVINRPVVREIKTLTDDTARRTADLREHREKNTAAMAVWAYQAEQHAYDVDTDRCKCGEPYLRCPGRNALDDYAMHLLGKATVTPVTVDATASIGARS